MQPMDMFKDFDMAMETACITIQHESQKWSHGVLENGLYRPRRPQGSPYYHCVEDHFETFERVYEERFERTYGFYRPFRKLFVQVSPGGLEKPPHIL